MNIAHRAGWDLVRKNRNRDEIPFSVITKNYEDKNFSVANEITKIAVAIPTKKINNYYNEAKSRTCWELRASGMTMREIGKKVCLHAWSVRNYMKRTICFI